MVSRTQSISSACWQKYVRPCGEHEGM